MCLLVYTMWLVKGVTNEEVGLLGYKEKLSTCTVDWWVNAQRVQLYTHNYIVEYWLRYKIR